MNRSRGTSVCALACVVLLGVASVEAGTPTLGYHVRVDDLSSRTLHVTLRVSGLDGDSFVLHGVPVYMDNPTVAAADSAVRDLHARADTGRALRVEPIGTTDGHPAWRVQAGGDAVISYDLFVDFRESRQTRDYPILTPYMTPEQAWLYGNSLFCFPQLGEDVRTSANQPADITVSFEHPGIPLAGVTDAVHLASIYQLMSIQFGLGAFGSTAGSARGIEFAVLNRDSDDFTTDEHTCLVDMTRRIIRAEVDFFGGAPFRRFSVLYYRTDGIGGLEGSNAFQCYATNSLALTDTTAGRTRAFYSVAVHELFHTWNPVYVTATEDPWIKEGVTSYYHLVLGGRLGYLTPADIAESLAPYAAELASNPLVCEIALTDPRLWTQEYDSEDWRRVTYERGMVTALLLDVHIREATGNEHSLDDVMAYLTALYTNRGYDHDQLLDAIREATGADPTVFFERRVDGIDAPSRAEVDAAYRRAVELGVFDRAR